MDEDCRRIPKDKGKRRNPNAVDGLVRWSGLQSVAHEQTAVREGGNVTTKGEKPRPHISASLLGGSSATVHLHRSWNLNYLSCSSLGFFKKFAFFSSLLVYFYSQRYLKNNHFGSLMHAATISMLSKNPVLFSPNEEVILGMDRKQFTSDGVRIGIP